MRTIDEVYLSAAPVTAELTRTLIAEIEGDPLAKKTTPSMVRNTNLPTYVRVSQGELELTYACNPTIFNGINKIVQTIMSADHRVTAKDPKVLAYFTKFIDNLGNSGSDITWNELLSQIYKYQCIYGWAWVENVYNKNNNRIVDWDLIDPKKMDYAKTSTNQIALDKYGKPLGYVEILPAGLVTITSTNLPPGMAGKVSLQPSSIYLEPKRIALMKLYSVGDGFYPIGLVEPIYKTSLRKMNMEEALTNAIYRHGFPTYVASVGDINHEPTPQQIQSILSKLKDTNYKQELAVPYYMDVKILESKKAEKLRENLEYFREQEITGLGIPKPYATGGGEDTNRATLTNQSEMFMLTLRDIITNTINSIRKYMFKPICALEGFTEVPDIRWDVIGPDELDRKVKRLLAYVSSGVVGPASIAPFVEQTEGISSVLSPPVPTPPQAPPQPVVTPEPTPEAVVPGK